MNAIKRRRRGRLTLLSYRKARRHTQTESSRRAGAYGLGAMGAAASVDGNLAHAFRAFFGCRIRGGLGPVHTSNQNIHWRHHEVINCGRDQQERYRGVDEVTDRKVRIANRKAKIRKIRLADHGGNERREQVFSEGGNDSGEGCANDHADSHVHNVAAKNELLEPAEHRLLRSGTKEYYGMVAPSIAVCRRGGTRLDGGAPITSPP